MADRFWVGGTGNINDTARWAATSGGAGGQSVPTAADNAFFDGLSDRLTTQSVTSITRVSTTATVTCNSHGYSAGNTVTISGANETEYNGTFTISNVATNTFDYTVTGTPATPATGTITVARRAAFTVTINAAFSCLDFIAGDGIVATTLTQNMTMAGASALTISGSLFFPATRFSSTHTGTYTFNATTTGKTVTVNGVNLLTTDSRTMTFSGNGGEWTLGSALSYTSNNFNSIIHIVNGTFRTGNFNVTTNIFYSSGSLTRALYLGSSTISASYGSSGDATLANFGAAEIAFVGTNLTIDAGTSNFDLGSVSGNRFVSESGFTYNKITMNSLNASVQKAIVANNCTINILEVNALVSATRHVEINGAITFGNITTNTYNTPYTRYVLFNANCSVTGTLSINAGNTIPTRQMVFASSVIGETRTLTCNTITIGDGVGFRNITVAGAAAPFNASTKATGNLGGNSGITFPAAKTVYWNLAGSQNWSANGWATTSTGTPAAANFPLAQDTAVFTEVGAAGTVSIEQGWPIGTLTFDDGVSPRATGVTLNVLLNPTIYGNLKLSSGVVLAGTANPIYFSGQTSQTITSVGKTISSPIYLDSPGGSLTLADNLALDTSRDFFLVRGTLDLSNRILTVRRFSSNNSNTRAIAFGTSGRISIIGNDGTVVDFNNPTNFSFSGTSDIQLTYTGSTGVRFIKSGSFAVITENNVLSYRISAGLDTIVMYTENYVSSYRNLIFEDAFSGIFGQNTGNASREPGVAYGNVRLSPNMTFDLAGGDLTFAATSSTQQLTMSGLTFPRSITKSGAGSLQLMDNLTLASTRTFTHTAGSVLLNGKILTTPAYSTSNTNLRTLAFGTGELVLNGTGTVWNAATSNGLSISAGTGVIRITDTSATGKTFAGGGVQTYPDLRIEGGTSTSTITLTGANRFSKMTNARTVGYTIVFPNDTTTFNAWGLSGTDGNLVTLSRTGGSGQFTIQSGSSGLLIAQFVSISNSIFLPSGNGYAAKSTNGGNNNGWVFGTPTFGKFLVFFNP